MFFEIPQYQVVEQNSKGTIVKTEKGFFALWTTEQEPEDEPFFDQVAKILSASGYDPEDFEYINGGGGKTKEEGDFEFNLGRALGFNFATKLENVG